MNKYAIPIFLCLIYLTSGCFSQSEVKRIRVAGIVKYVSFDRKDSIVYGVVDEETETRTRGRKESIYGYSITSGTKTLFESFFLAFEKGDRLYPSSYVMDYAKVYTQDNCLVEIWLQELEDNGIPVHCIIGSLSNIHDMKKLLGEEIYYAGYSVIPGPKQLALINYKNLFFIDNQLVYYISDNKLKCIDIIESYRKGAYEVKWKSKKNFESFLSIKGAGDYIYVQEYKGIQVFSKSSGEFIAEIKEHEVIDVEINREKLLYLTQKNGLYLLKTYNVDEGNTKVLKEFYITPLIPQTDYIRIINEELFGLIREGKMLVYDVNNDKYNNIDSYRKSSNKGNVFKKKKYDRDFDEYILASTEFVDLGDSILIFMKYGTIVYHVEKTQGNWRLKKYLELQNPLYNIDENDRYIVFYTYNQREYNLRSTIYIIDKMQFKSEEKRVVILNR